MQRSIQFSQLRFSDIFKSEKLREGVKSGAMMINMS